jgi:hypothetical protein
MMCSRQGTRREVTKLVEGLGGVKRGERELAVVARLWRSGLSPAMEVLQERKA